MTETSQNATARGAASVIRRLLRLFHPSHQHSASSATFLLMSAVMLSRVVGYVREAYIAYAFGARAQTDAYVAAFQLPDWLNYLVAGGTASITFISIYTRLVAEKREDEAQQTFSIIITVMTAVLLMAIGLAEIFTYPIERWMFHSFRPEQLELCVSLTRILLPAQAFFYVGGIVSAVLLSRRLFLLPAFGPLLYNIFIILGGVVMGSRLGIASLAYGALAGSVIGPFLINALGAAQVGMGYKPAFDLKNPAFREWVKLSIPLMLGVSLVTADDWILRYFASSGTGDISKLNFAKRLFAVPIAVLGQATGQASLPFFARLFSQQRRQEFSTTVSNSVYRITAASFLVSALMMATALPVIDIVYRRGLFVFRDSEQTSVYFFWFSFSLAFWAAQGLYSRAFYAAGDTLTPMIAATVLTLASLPVYAALFRTFSVVGLAIASDLGIVANTLALAILLDRRRLVPVIDLRWGELGKAALTAVAAGLASYSVSKAIEIKGSRRAELFAVTLATLTWGITVALGLWLLRSDLLQELTRKRRVAYPRLAERQAEETTGGIEP